MNEIIKGLINKGYTSEDATIIYNSAFKLKNIIGDITYWCGKPTPLGVGWIALDT